MNKADIAARAARLAVFGDTGRFQQQRQERERTLAILRAV